MLTSVLVVCFGVGGSPSALAEAGDPPETSNPYFTSTTMVMEDGKEITKVSIGGPATPPPGYERAAVSLPDSNKEMGIVTLTVPAYGWSFGCSATSASMIAAYWDRNGFANMYTGPTDGGVMPMDSSSWGTFTDGAGDSYDQCPLTASRDGLDGRVGRGSIDDYWVEYIGGFIDPFITNDWTEHTWGSAVGDYMKTSQYNYYNDDGSTSFYQWTIDPSQFTCNDMESYGIADFDGAYGWKLFYEARGYTVTDCFTQKTDNTAEGGFSFVQYKAEIDAGRPVMIHVIGHTMVGVGYDESTQTVYLHDTWDYGTYTMPWGGDYYGMVMSGVSIVNLNQGYPLNVSKTGTGSGTVTSTPAGISCGADCAENYSAGTVVKLTTTAAADSSFSGWSGACGGTGFCWVTMSAAKNVTAAFTLNPIGTYKLTVSKTGTGSGTVTSTPAGISCGTDCTEFYNTGSVVKLTATASAGSTFTGWSGACGGTGYCWVTMSAAKNVKANFLVTPAGKYYLGVSRKGTGTGTVTSTPAGINCGTDCYEFFTSGVVVKLTAAPAAGSTFTGWSGACGGTGTNCWVSMSKAKYVTATFSSTSGSLSPWNKNIVKRFDPTFLYMLLKEPGRLLRPLN
jgi:hypothetical protein